MPIYEVICKNEACVQFDVVREVFYKSYRDDMPPCPECLVITRRIPSISHAIWLGTLDKYNDSSIGGVHNACEGGHIAYRTRSSRMLDGSPEPVRITTRQEQREYCRAEGLTMPDEMPHNIDWSEKSASSQGLPGCWASVNPDFIAEQKARPLPERKPDVAEPIAVPVAGEPEGAFTGD